jgi:uncharacterized membrane protein HdeD (DUF308 family)
MDISLLLARVLGLTLLVTYASFLTHQKFYRYIAKDIPKHPSVLVISGFISLICGLLILQVHSDWSESWKSIITAFGWLLTFVGVCRLLFPELVLRFSAKLLQPKYQMLLTVTASLMGLLGAYLSYMGFAG